MIQDSAVVPFREPENFVIGNLVDWRYSKEQRRQLMLGTTLVVKYMRLARVFVISSDFRNVSID